MEEEDVWLSQDEDEDDQRLATSTDPTTFNLSLTYRGGQEIGYHLRNKDGEYQRAVVSAYQGGPRKKPVFNVGCEAKAIIHGQMSPTSSKKATLLVYGFKFLSRRKTRLKEADIIFEFKPVSSSPTSSGPSVLEVRPKGEHKMEETISQGASKMGLSLNIGPSIPGVDVGLTLSKERNVSTDTKFHTTIKGDNPAELVWGGHYQAHFTLAENEAQKSGIPTELTVVIFLERDDDEDFEMLPQIEVTPDFRTMLVSLGACRSSDDSIYFRTQEPPFNKLDGKVKIDPNNLSNTDMDSLWICTMYNLYSQGESKAEGGLGEMA